MDLKKIKLAGFKSFVDPTTVDIPSHLVAIVGPNGCGKSNVIDAVRWVMGESSAKHLRGESMADVIFNGSSARKPVGQASIELVFDNTDASLGGEYEKYAEISIKRQVNRDGQAAYYLNGTRCRRRDITDIFLGTGLGPRSYAIIEQGMISRLIDAKPEEFRSHIEEAAGISKYKERRRETENRIQHTRENLARLNDLISEIDKQLQQLTQQAESAEQYKTLKQQERLLIAQLHALKWRTLDAAVNTQNTLIQQQEQQLSEYNQNLLQLDAGLEEKRSQYNQANTDFHTLQAQYYEIGGRIGRLEQEIAHQTQLREKMQVQLQELENAQQTAEHHVTADDSLVADLTIEQQTLLPQVETEKAAEMAAVADLQAKEEAMRALQKEWDKCQQQLANSKQQAEIYKTTLQHLEQAITQAETNLTRLKTERETLSPKAKQQQIIELQTELGVIVTEKMELQEKVTQAVQLIQHERHQSQQHMKTLDAGKLTVQSLHGKLSSLKALQKAALGQQQKNMVDWLTAQGLHNKPRLAETIRVESSWTQAVERVLGDKLEAICIDNLNETANLLNELKQGSLLLFETVRNEANITHSLHQATLLDKVSGEVSLANLLSGIYCADNLEEALALRQQLASHESVITQQGVWLGKNWLRVVLDKDEKTGVLQREQDIAELQTQIQTAEAAVAEAQAAYDNSRKQVEMAETDRETLQQRVAELQRVETERRSALGALEAQVTAMLQRISRVDSDIVEHQNVIQQKSEKVVTVKHDLTSVLAVISEYDVTKTQLVSARETQTAALETARQAAYAAREKSHAVSLQLQAVQTRLEATEKALVRFKTDLHKMTEQKANLEQSMLESESPITALQQTLMAEKLQQVEAETACQQAQSALTEMEAAIKQLEVSRTQTDKAANQNRSELEKVRMEWQALSVRLVTVQEALAEMEQNIETLLSEMPEEAEEKAWETKIQKIGNKINRLGPINLAAIEQAESEKERKTYLDTQHTDLLAALDTLEQAIEKIDKETKMSFKETFDKVNEHLKTLFPRVFAGGDAWLEMTGDDLLSSGITLMARPPGKRNSTIHLLSGGEKALTAIALVFSLFQLNPAPFCLLDEVDAPLDDANVGRFCKLVKEMSKTVQFIYITHNKIAMEMAEHLMGVTMHEAGVSRLVSVNVEEAAAMVV